MMNHNCTPPFKGRLILVLASISCLTLSCMNLGCGNPDQSNLASTAEDFGGEMHVYVDFKGSDITDNDLIDFPFPDDVRFVSLKDTAITDQGVRELLRANNLSVVDLRNTPTTDEAVDILMQMPRLNRAQIASPDISYKKQQQLMKFLSNQREKIQKKTSMKMAN
jgi:hypothetical protein